MSRKVDRKRDAGRRLGDAAGLYAAATLGWQHMQDAAREIADEVVGQKIADLAMRALEYAEAWGWSPPKGFRDKSKGKRMKRRR